MRRFCRYALPLLFLLVVFAACSGEENIVGNGVGGNSDRQIVAFSFTSPSATGVIDTNANTVLVTMPYGSQRTNLTPYISLSQGASVSPPSGVAQNFSVPVQYTVTAEDGGSSVWTVTVVIASSDSKALTGFSFDTVPVSTGVINESGGTVTVTVPYGTDRSTLVATFSTSGTNVYVGVTKQVSGVTVNNFTAPVVYRVYAADGGSRDYTVTVTVGAASTACDITTLSINGMAGTISGTNITVTMPSGTDLASLSPSITVSAGATVSPASGVAQNFNNSPLSYLVTAQNGTTTKRYAVTARTNTGGGSGGYTWYTETFDNATATGSSYIDGTSSANSAGITWSFHGRTDINMEPGNKSLIIGKDGAGYLQATLSGGCGRLKFRFKKAFTDVPSVVVKVNGSVVHTTALATDTIQDSGEIEINQAGSCIIRLEAGSGGHRVNIDDVAWTEGTPAESDPPTVSIGIPVNGAAIESYQIYLSGTAADSGDDASGVEEVWARIDGGSYVKVSGTMSWSHTFNTVSAGGHTIDVYSRDAAGNISAVSSVSVTVTHPVDATAPSASFTSPAEGATVSGGLTVTGTASDVVSGVKEVWVKVDGGSYVKASGTTSWSHSFSGLTPGAHVISLYAVDNADNSSTPVTRNVTLSLPVWTVMVYLDADNNLEGSGVDDFQEMEKGIYAAIAAGNGGITNNVNIIVLMDRISGESTSDGNWTDTRLFHILPDNTSSSVSTRLDDGVTSKPHHIANLGERNMGDPATLTWFLNYCRTEFPAQNYGLVLWNHGGGTRARTTRSLKPLTKAVCWDDTNGEDCLYINELQTAIANAGFNSGSKLGFLGFDACLMGMVETAYEFRNLAQYFIGAMNSEQGDGWDYEYIFTHIGDGSTTTPQAFGTVIVDGYRDFIENGGGSNAGEAISVSDLGQIAALKTQVDLLAYYMNLENAKTALLATRDASVDFAGGYYEDFPFYDLGDFCARIVAGSYSTALKNQATAVITALSAVVVKAYGEAGTDPSEGNGQPYYFGTGAVVKRGLSIFFTTTGTTPSWYVNTAGPATGDGYLDFCTTGSGVSTWRDLLEAWY